MQLYITIKKIAILKGITIILIPNTKYLFNQFKLNTM